MKSYFNIRPKIDFTGTMTDPSNYKLNIGGGLGTDLYNSPNKKHSLGLGYIKFNFLMTSTYLLFIFKNNTREFRKDISLDPKNKNTKETQINIDSKKKRKEDDFKNSPQHPSPFTTYTKIR
ncbi:hypothetical protein Avbf_14293 [Armadillidium vulgare]|nr:hypothetical protein Avbf_14293 [Armadillidium vulgare]